ncbi:MAG: GNAT family N-acetyltransferase [Rhizobiaceae bacterium]
MSVDIGDGPVYFRGPELRDYKQWKKLRQDSANFLIPWEPRWPEDDLTWTGYRRRMKYIRQDMKSGVGLTFFIFDRETDQIVGGMTFSNIRHGSVRGCQLGYWMGEAFAGKGFMKIAVRNAIYFLFTNTSLERVEAVCLPENDRSIGLLKRLGFRKEGEIREYMEINGERRDHLLFGILKTEFLIINSQLQEKETQPFEKFETSAV